MNVWIVETGGGAAPDCIHGVYGTYEGALKAVDRAWDLARLEELDTSEQVEQDQAVVGHWFDKCNDAIWVMITRYRVE